jgi:hypothetical protein
MRKIILAIALSLSLVGSGCAPQLAVLSAATKTIDNPVTKNDLFQIEASLKLVTTGLKTYRRLCLQDAVDKNCRSNIEAIQPYSSQVYPLLAELSSFVRTNDQINAIVVYKRLVNIYTSITTEAAARGISLGV